MGAILRDAQCAEDVGKMAELGYFEEEFVFFGCAYLENGHIKYHISGKEERICDFIEDCVLLNLYPTPVREILQRQLVPSGELESIKIKYKLQLAKMMQSDYPRIYFDTLQRFSTVANSDDAYSLLLDIQEKLEGRFEEEELHIYEGLVQMAFEAKVLTRQSYDTIHLWLKKMRMQMEDDVIIKETFSRTLYGFVYEKAEGQLDYFFNAQKTAAMKQKMILEQNGFLVSPLFIRTYWLDALAKLAQAKQDYAQHMSEVFNKNYMNLVREIRNLPSVIEREEFLQALSSLETQGYLTAQTALKGYGYRWNVLKQY